MAVNTVSVQPPWPVGSTWVVKLGSAALSRDGGGLDEAMLARWVERFCRLRDVHGTSLVLVSSGAVAEGLARLQWSQRPREVHRLQAAASVGQPGLMQAYERLFRLRGVLSAQILLTHGDLADRDRHRNVKATLHTLLNLKVVPVVNQNDAVSTEEIGGGDNDGLAALVARMVGAERLVLVGEQETSMSSAAGAPSARKAMREPLRAERLPALWGGTTSVVAAQEPDCLLRLAQEPSPVGATLAYATRAEAPVVQI
jgi:glutamate 5-kinase